MRLLVDQNIALRVAVRLLEAGTTRFTFPVDVCQQRLRTEFASGSALQQPRVRQLHTKKWDCGLSGWTYNGRTPRRGATDDDN